MSGCSHRKHNHITPLWRYSLVWARPYSATHLEMKTTLPTRLYVMSIFDLIGLDIYVLISSIPWYITIPPPPSVTSTQKRRQNTDLDDAIWLIPCAVVSSANPWSNALNGRSLYFIVISLRRELISVLAFQVSAGVIPDINFWLKN